MKRKIQASAVTMLSLMAAISLAGCSNDKAASSDAKPNSSNSSNANNAADAFVSCLKSEGLQARVSADGGMAMIPDNSMDIQTNSDGGDSSSIVSSDSEQVGEMVGLEVDDSNQVWAAFPDSSQIKDANTQSAYKACEAKFPDFKQVAPDYENDPAFKEMMAEMGKSALEFAKCGREAGYSWLADPTAKDPTSLVVPEGTDASEFKSLLNSCPGGDRISWQIPDGLADVFNEYMQNSGETK